MLDFLFADNVVFLNAEEGVGRTAVTGSLPLAGRADRGRPGTRALAVEPQRVERGSSVSIPEPHGVGYWATGTTGSR